MGDLQVRWTGGDEPPGAPLVTDEFDQEAKPADAGKPDAGKPDARKGERR
jgi:segregation and condensation protein A